ncbi:hypothetical protein EPUS_01089 [Endocarpon pusillum Z07020]|uniref:Citrate synthase n=1 Tax=Endocarpon pusillum (strain Z07020 / HMAS-L-300199) TaxID=1263415 RepID=U1GAW0_ENDPU|nr:uncharacterized protein EPUS_01089 [Endocarpon pusillum Z07020]ERF69133.1 hypothetical protein EPUS_01089 [Endocarpon pusillum Z07020]
MAAVVLPPTTTGTLGLWNGTKDGEAGYIDYATGNTNMNRPKEVDIVAHDIRHISPQPTLLKNGYQLTDIPTSVTTEEFLNSQTPEGKKHIEDVYFPECAKIIEKITGGVGLVIPTSFRLREQKGNTKQSTNEKLGEVEARYAPRPVAHLDRDTPTAIMLLKETVGAEKADELLSKYKHWAQVNTWRPIGNPATKWPLCFINHDRIPNWDYDTHVGHIFSKNDPLVADRGAKPYVCVVKHDDRYDYHYVSSLRPAECLVFCSFDSDPKLAMPHSAFWDNSTPDDAPNRRSIEPIPIAVSGAATNLKMNGVKTQANEENGVATEIIGDYLHVLDSRTWKTYKIPISDNFVRASDLSVISAPEVRQSKESGAERVRKLAVLDPGFQHTACKESAITLIDGEKGELWFRGMRIEDLFRHYDFDTTMYLLIWGHLPTNEEKERFEYSMAAAASPPRAVVDAIQALPRETDMYSILLTGLAAYVGTDTEMITSRHNPVLTYHNNMAHTDAALIRTIAYTATATAVAYCHKRNIEFTQPKQGFSLVENFLLMIGIDDLDKKISRTMDRLWILYADHELSCSTAASLHTASTLTDPLSCVLAMMVAGAGPLHVGAIELCYEGLEMLGTVDNVPAYIEAVKARKFRLFGYGHRVYKTKDPRATRIEELMEEHKEAIAADPLLQVAMEIDKQANTDPYFVERELKLNADFYSCFIYTAL